MAMKENELHLYYVRIHDQQEKLTLYADFENKLALPFSKGKQLTNNSNSSPFIYTLDFKLKKETDEQILIQQDDQEIRVNKFILQGSRRFARIGMITYYEKDDKTYILENYLHIRHHFLLDVRFDSRLSTTFPGLNTNYFINLCLFTCFILHERSYDIFDILIEQFQTLLNTKSDPYKKFSFTDFFDSCNQYLLVALNDSEETLIRLKIILRMIGCLFSPISEYFLRFDKYSISFADWILRGVQIDINRLYQLVNENERTLFKNGLVILLCIKIFHHKRHSSKENELVFLQTMLDQDECQDIANRLLDQIEKYNISIVGNSNWTDLFALVDPKKIKIEHLNFADSFESFTRCITNISKVLIDSEHFQKQIGDYFEERLAKNHIRIDLDGIVCLLNFLEDTSADSTLITFVQTMIESSSNLAINMKDYFDVVIVNDENIEQVSQIFTRIYKHLFLNNVDIFVVFRKTLTEGKSSDYYVKWFEYFLAKGNVWKNIHPNSREKYFEKWAIKSMFSNKSLIHILKSTDRLIDSFDLSDEDDEFQMVFINRLVGFCSTLFDNIYQIIEDGLLYVKNTFFRVKFMEFYNQTFLIHNKLELYKDVMNPKNPLLKLIRLNRKAQYQSLLVRDLIQNIYDPIEITKDELLDAILNRPKKSTLIYTVLTEESFHEMPIRRKILKELIDLWNNWEKNGCQVAETQTWNRLTIEQRDVVYEIWKRTEEITGRNIPFKLFITEANRKVQSILKIKEDIKICIAYYCKNALDFEHYVNLIRKLDEEADRQTVDTFNLPDELQQIQKYANYLNTIIQSFTWRIFLKEKLESDNSDYNLILESNADAAHVSYQQKTCLDTLNVVSKIFYLFVDHLNHLCDDQQQAIFPQLQKLFPQKQSVSFELTVMKSLLIGQTMSRLELLLKFWENQDEIISFSKGCMNLCMKYSIEIQGTLTILQDLLKMDKQTSTETCLRVYQDYCTHYVNKDINSIYKLISHWNCSFELLKFLYSLTVTDVDDLLEVVNDWDEASMNTKTVLDFVMLTRFILTLNRQIESIRKDKPLVFDDVIICLKEITSENEVKNILSSFESCSKNLSTIQRIYTESKNKEQSKKRRILDIVNNAKFCFCLHQSKDAVHLYNYQFDVHITNMNWEPISFLDLNDLRDRARLIQYAQDNGNDLQNYTPTDIQQLQLFISLVDNIEEILQNFSSLYTSGYPVVKQYPMSRRRFACQQGQYEELEQFKKTLAIQFADWDKELCAKYKQCGNLTYLSYQQIGIVENAIRKETLKKSSDLSYHLLKFMDINPELIQPTALPNKTENPFDLLQHIAPILRSECDSRSFPLQEDEKINKIFLIETTDSGILRAILSVFHMNDISTPVANRLFYCTKATTWIEIKAFIYRCFYSQTLHQLIRPELLSIVIQDQFAQLLNELTEQLPKHLYRLGIITKVAMSHLYLINSLKSYRPIVTIRDQELLNEEALRDIIQKLTHARCMLVTSKIAGLGKSTYIQNEIKQTEKTQVKLSINGDITIDTLMERLRDDKIQSSPTTIALHINIGPMEKVEQLNEFLYSLIIFRRFRFGQIPVDVPIEIPIYIEWDSSPHLNNLLDKIVIFKYIERTHIDHMNLDELQSNLPTIQLVVNYLQAIDDKTIDTQEINEQTMTLLGKAKCVSLLEKHFLREKNLGFVSWTQLSIFISVYYRLFTGFSKCGFFIIDDPQNPSTLRSDISNTLLQSADQFTSLSVEKVRENQCAAQGNDVVLSFSDAIIRWDTTKPFIVIFTASYDPLFVYKTPEHIPPSLNKAFRSYYHAINRSNSTRAAIKRKFSSIFKIRSSTKHAEEELPLSRKSEKQLQEFLADLTKLKHEEFFLRLAPLSNKYFLQKSICLTCFKQYDFNANECATCRPMDSAIVRPNLNTDIEDFQILVASKLQSQYILTPDNYIKMLLIYLRVQSNLPVLIMGETGCGKTALIQFLCQKILDNEMFIFRIHAGVTSEQIIDRMHEYTEKAYRYLKMDENKRIWVFLDEFNTTPNIGLLKEIICERTLLGEFLPKNMVFLGACNPQRRKTSSEDADANVGVKKYHSEMQRQLRGETSPLLYSVVPIPETMLQHIWDYGHLDDATEKTYIETILSVCRLPPEDESWSKCMVKLISESQKYIRRCEDVSSVSLRDVSRFCRFYKWFYSSLIAMKESVTDTQYSFTTVERACLLALFLCYYFRLNSSAKRKEYLQIIGDFIKELKSNKPYNTLDEMLQAEKMNLVKRMELPPGTATNRALTDNIFVLYTCILNRIPVILCGKPGCSKTSAVQIVISNLRGKSSTNSFFHSHQELIAVSYQGSQNCTSDSIIKVFERADRYANKNKSMELLPVIVFDEIGLAELSPHNPLKVLHSELEIENCRHGFVGLSNWRLDASKMNRAVYLACPEPDLEDLKLTATTLSESMAPENSQSNSLDHPVIEALAKIYMNICEQQQYFGLRDYYSLIKGIVRDLLRTENKEEDLFKIVRHHLSCNFDDIINGSKIMWSQFCEYMHQTEKIVEYSAPNFVELLQHSLSSRSGRFLMLIGDGESTFDYVQRYITNKYSSIQTKTLIGSTLEGDFLSASTYTEQYNTRVLMDIILYAEKEITLFLRGLRHLYDNLYDLFNQSYAVSAKKKYCRIALGSLYHPRCLVNDEFYCVVFIKQEDRDKYDAPFLNRFEKHVIDLASLIDEHHQTLVSKLSQWMNDLLSNEKVTCTKDLFIWSRPDYLLSLVTEAFDHLERSSVAVNDQNVLNYCQNQILRISSFDLPLLLSLKDKSDHQQLIQQYYQIHNNLSLATFLQEEFHQKKNDKLLIYTYTQIYQTINFNSIDNHQSWIEVVRLTEFNTELELMRQLKTHNLKKSKSLLCIRIDYHRDYQHLPMLKYVLLNIQSTDVSRGVCLIFHLQRCELNQARNDVFFDGWSRAMIDDLEKHEPIPEKILTNPSYGNLITHLNFLNLEKKYEELISGCIIKLRYTVTNKDDEVKINDRRTEIIKQFIKQQTNLSLYSLLKKHLIEITQNLTQSNDWREDLLTNGIINGSSRSFNDALFKTILNFLDSYLSMLFLYLEKYSLIDSFLFVHQSTKQIHTKLFPFWSNCWNMTLKKVTHISIINEEYTNIPLVFGLHLPYAMIEYDTIHQIRQNIAQTQQNNPDENLVDSAYRQLISTSIYGEFINQIFQDSDLFYHYFHDQLTLTRNEANVHHLSTSFIQRLLTPKISSSAQDRLRHLFIDYEELFEIMKLFEISLSLLGDEDALLKLLDQQLVIFSNEQNTTVRNDSILYQLVIKASDFYSIPPKSLNTSDKTFQSQADPFIETCLLNLVELLVSLPIVKSTKSIEQLIRTYNLFIQCTTRLMYYGHYEIKNLEKLNSVLRLATCIALLFHGEKAFEVFKNVYNYNNNNLLGSREQISTFIAYLKSVISQQQTTIEEQVVQETILKFQNELVTNWFMDNIYQYADVLDFINTSQRDLWAYSAKIFTLIDRSLRLSLDIKENNGKIPENDQINQYLTELNDPTRKMEVLISTRAYAQLVLDEKYRARIINDENSAIIKVLKNKKRFNAFEMCLSEIITLQDDQRFALISQVAWLKYYLLYYIYALKHDFKDEIMGKIDQTLARNTSPFCSTVKLYIIKQLCNCQNMTFHDLYNEYINRNLAWFDRTIIHQDVIIPLPLFECTEEFKRINEELSVPITDTEMRELIRQCSKHQNKAYCFLVWFIHRYTRFYKNNANPNDQFIKFLENNGNLFDTITSNFIYSLCKNFNENSFFHLKPSMTEDELHQRLVILNVIAVLISFKFNKNRSTFSFLLFEENGHVPKKYSDHFEELFHLTGVAQANDPALQQMMHIRTKISNQHNLKIDIFRCSSDCPWLFCIENSNISNEHKRCPLCQNTTSISQNGDIFVMNRPHIPMNQNQALEFISKYIEEHRYKNYLNMEEKPNHLSQPISFHFLSFLINAIFLFLHEFNYLSGTTSTIRNYFQTCIQKHLTDANQSYFWLYKLFNHMIDPTLAIEGDLSTEEKITEFEKSIEEKLILPHIRSVTKEIREYKSYYTDFAYEDRKQEQIISFVEELLEDNEKYPLLNFFNVTNIHSIDIIQHFHSELQLQPNYERTYPLSTFLLKRIADYDNIPHLYSLIKFTNYLIQNFNYRIEREKAKTTKISQFLKEHPDVQSIYEQFEEHWHKINLNEVSFNQQNYQWEYSEEKYHFADTTNISMFLLNKSSTNESILPIACLHTIANLQNEILDYLHSYVITDKDRQHTIPLQSIQQKHLFDFDIDRMRTNLFEIGLMINYQYGMSQEIIYNFDEIEWTLKNEISCLPKIDTQSMRYFNYQFELYDENLSLINDIRQRFPQQLFQQQKRTQIKNSIDALDKDSTREISGSLEYILTYLKNINNQNIIEGFTIEQFISEYIHSSSYIDEKVKGGLLAAIPLANIIDLYELNEECIFEKILSKTIPEELREETFSVKDRTKITQQFIETILGNLNLADCLKDFNVWIGMFKRLLVRLLLPKININFESSLSHYIKRSDMWKGDMTAIDIQKIEIKDDIRLKHTFIILKGLENKLKTEKSNVTTTLAMKSSNDGDDEEEEEDEDEDEKPTTRPSQNQGRNSTILRANLRLGGRQRR